MDDKGDVDDDDRDEGESGGRGGDNDDGDEDESGGKAGVARELFASGSPTAPALLPSPPATKSLRLLQ